MFTVLEIGPDWAFPYIIACASLLYCPNNCLSFNYKFDYCALAFLLFFLDYFLGSLSRLMRIYGVVFTSFANFY